jgi:sulfur-oxidizing protein SoxX
MQSIGFPMSRARHSVKAFALALALACIADGARASDIAPLAPAGDPARGRAIIVDRQKGFCLLCHSGPFPEQRFMGNLAPDLAGSGKRYSAAALRARLVDPARDAPNTIMPSYFRTDGLARVAKPYQGKPILDAQQIEDVVAFLVTLQGDAP